MLRLFRVKGMARVIHEMCCQSVRLAENGGQPSQFFQCHPMRKEYEECSNNLHRFVLDDGRQRFFGDGRR